MKSFNFINNYENSAVLTYVRKYPRSGKDINHTGVTMCHMYVNLCSMCSYLCMHGYQN